MILLLKNNFLSKLKDIINYNCGSLITSVPFFANTNADFITDIITKLKFEIFQPNDFIFKEGSVNNKMFFIQEGIVEIVKSDNKLIMTLADDSYFDDGKILVFFFLMLKNQSLIKMSLSK
jgi:signal-transduction protein with cAMP-binding, CBS, and nucleotidyltransferase domain